MRRNAFYDWLLAWVLIFAAVASVQAQPAKEEYQPRVGQQGKDVVWVPTPQALVDKMLDLAKVTAKDYVIDLGSGDGRTVITAAKRGARALGIEYNPEMAKYANEQAQAAGVAGVGPGKATIRQADIFQTDIKDATVITLYLLPALNMKLRPQLLALRPGTRVVSHSFTMDDWEADEISTLDGRRAYFWVVPAQVMGNWTLEANNQRMDLTLEQTFQKINGSVGSAPVHAGLRDTRLRGPFIQFSYVGQDRVRRDFNGRVDGQKMEGSFRDEKGGEGKWTAAKK
jgi:SAM-dependent methyltransferase